MKPLRIGSVPYLNAKPLIAWFDSPDCDADARIEYAVPSRLASMLREDALDVAMVSTFELFRNPDLVILPGMSISADGPVKSVRLFSTVPFDQVRSVALDTSSLTSAALVRVLLAEVYGLKPSYLAHPPDIPGMLSHCDAGLLIGDLKLFDSPARYILDLGEAWKAHTGLPFVYAAWLARRDAPIETAAELLARARDWGVTRLQQLSVEWAERMALPLDRVEDYFHNVMRYGLGPAESEGLQAFYERCVAHGLAPSGAGPAGRFAEIGAERVGNL